MPSPYYVAFTLLSLSHSLICAANIPFHNAALSDLGHIDRRSVVIAGDSPSNLNSSGTMGQQDGNQTTQDTSRIKLPLSNAKSGSQKERLEELDNGSPQVDLIGSLTTLNSSEGQTLSTIQFDRSALLTFLGDAYNYAAQQVKKTVGQQPQQSSTYFKYDGTQLSMIISVHDISLGGVNGKSIGWDIFGNAAAKLQNYTIKYLPNQNVTWVGVLCDPGSEVPKADLIITTVFVDVQKPRDITFPTPTLTISGVNNDRRDLVPNHDGSPSPHSLSLLSKRRNNLAIPGTQFTFSIFKSTTKVVITGILYELAVSAYNKIIGDISSSSPAGSSSIQYDQFTIPLNMGGGVLPAALQDVVFQFQVSGGAQAALTRTVMLQWLKTLTAYTEKYITIAGKHPTLQGQIFDANNVAVASYSLGTALDRAFVPLVEVAKCLVQNPDGSIVACFVRDEL